MKPKKPLSEFTLHEIKDSMLHFKRVMKSCKNLQKNLNDASEETLKELNKNVHSILTQDLEAKMLCRKAIFSGDFKSLLQDVIVSYQETIQSLKDELKRRDVMECFTNEETK